MGLPLIAASILFYPVFESKLLLFSLLFLLSVLFARWFAGIWVLPITQIRNALINRVDSFRDNDFSVSFDAERQDEFAELFEAHNQLGDLLREERQDIFQRELLLDTVIQSSPQVMLLADDHDRIIYANLAARRFFSDGRKLEHLKFSQVLDGQPVAVVQMMQERRTGLLTLESADGEQETLHHSHTRFELNSRYHDLYLIKQLTHELSREEVRVWKKLIRVISHELNNSLAPIRSLAHSAEKLLQKGDTERLQTILYTIAERSDHLKEFVDDYATFARLPNPILKSVTWRDFLGSLELLENFRLVSSLSQDSVVFDPIQMQQVLINLLKNAHESGSAAESVELEITQNSRGLEMSVKDRGQGMSERVLSNALLPFYSTKRTGSGIGLSLCREITEAHQGKIGLANRKGGGLCVTIWMPELRQP